MDLKNYLLQKKEAVDRALQLLFPRQPEHLAEITEAMKYSLLAGGKRLRPVLCMAGAEAVGGKGEDVMPVACALELIHTFSLIHDDLPVMDDDDTRRGKPTNHKVFGEAVALLAGDGLLIEAFKIMASLNSSTCISPEKLLAVMGLIARAAGYQGMVGGQVVDIRSEGVEVDLSTVEFIHKHKTGALITASVVSGAMLCNTDNTQIRKITSYGNNIGLAFQVADDILDIEGDSNLLGKKAGADMQRNKTTYPSVIGLEESRHLQQELIESAVQALDGFDNKADPLRMIAQYIIKRDS